MLVYLPTYAAVIQCFEAFQKNSSPNVAIPEATLKNPDGAINKNNMAIQSKAAAERYRRAQLQLMAGEKLILLCGSLGGLSEGINLSSDTLVTDFAN